jgi:protein phosphatase
VTRTAVTVAVVAALATAAVFGFSWSHFVGADQATGRVAVYQGIPVDLPFGLRLYRETYQSGVYYALLSTAQRQRLFDGRLRSSADAMQAVRAVQAEMP